MINIKYQVKETNHISKLKEYTGVGDVNKGEGESEVFTSCFEVVHSCFFLGMICHSECSDFHQYAW